MSTKSRDLKIKVTDEKRGDGMRQTSNDVDSLTRKITTGSQTWARALGNFAKVAAVGLGVAGVAAVKFGMDAVAAAEEVAQIQRQTDAVIESTGGIANVTASDVSNLAGELSRLSGVDDDLIASGQNVLLTFTRVRNEVGAGNDIFDQASLSALNMSSALGTDLQSSMIMIGKALNDPIRGITSMTRAGIQFTDQQKDQIRTLVESGDLLGAQRIILGELETQFSGSAEANATVSDKMRVAFGNLQEAIGAKLLPIAEKLSEWVEATLIPTLEDFSAWVEREGVPRLKDMGKWIGDHIVPAVQALASWVSGTLVPALVAFGTWLADHERVLQAVGIAIVAMLVPAFVAWAISAGAAAIATIAAMLPIIALGVAVGVLAFLVITHFDTIKRWISNVFNWVKDNWPLLLAILTGPIGLAVLLIKTHWDTIKDGVTGVKDWIVRKFNEVVGFVTGLPGKLADAASGLWNWVSSGLSSAVGWVRGQVNDLIRIFNRLPGPDIPLIGGGASRTFGDRRGRGGRQLAEGGIVRATPGGIMATIGEGRYDEAVIPLKPGMNLGGGTTVNVYVSGVLATDKRQIEQVVVDAVRSAADKGVPLTARGRSL